MLIEFTDRGLFCRQGAFYIDPWKPVDAAVITHAHSDHAHAGSGSYLCHERTTELLRLRLGENNYQGIPWNEKIFRNGVQVSLHPAGHMIGSSQIRVEYKGEVWVISGDYKTENDGISGAFEPVKCHQFVTESTFGLPIYSWKPQMQIFESMKQWIVANQSAGYTSVLFAYSLGKSQRLINALGDLNIPIYAHGAIANVQDMLMQDGWNFPTVIRITKETPADQIRGNIVIAPASAEQSPWMKRFNPYRTGVCSGWMQVRGNTRRRNTDAGFALSDHADWKGLLDSIQTIAPEKVYVTHGFQSVFSRYLNEKGIAAAEVKTEFGTEEEAVLANEQSDES